MQDLEISSLTVAFFLPEQHKPHHEYGLNFFASNFVRKGCMGNVFKWTISFRILFSLKRYLIFYPFEEFILHPRNIQKFKFFVWDVSQQYEFYIQYLFCILQFNLKSISNSQGIFIFKFPVQHVYLKYRQYSHLWVVKGK